MHSPPDLSESDTRRAPSSLSSHFAHDVWRLALLLGAFFFAFLGARPLNNPDEGRYTEIPREMAAGGDYVTPRLDGVKYFEKPPLIYWLSAVTFAATGVNEWTARFWCAAFAVAGGLLTYAAGRALYDRNTGIFAALILSLSLLYYALSRVVLTDLVVAVLIAAALFSFLLALREPAGWRRRWLFWSFYASMALATLTKGLIGFVLPCGAAFFALLLLNDWRRLRPFHPFTGTALLLLIAAPWHVLAARANDDFLYFYFIHEHFLRFTTRIHGRFEPWYFFIPVLLGGLFPWTLFVPQAMKLAFSGGWRARRQNDVAWFLLVWIVVIVAFFSYSQSKLVPYILPVFPAAAVLLGRYLARVWDDATLRGARPGLWGFAGLAVALSLAVAAAPVPAKYPELAAPLLPWRFALGVTLGGGAAAVAWCLVRGRIRVALVALTVTCAAAFTATNFVAAIADTRSTKTLALALRERLQPGDGVYCVGEYFQDFPVYLGRLVDVVDYEGELAFGIHAEPGRTASRFIDGATFLARWRGLAPAYALVQKDALHVFADPSVPRHVVAENLRYVLLANHAP